MNTYLLGPRKISLTKSLGRGGEGEVFAVKGYLGIAVKIYHHRERAAREFKVDAMVDAGLANHSDLIAFPSATVREPNGRFAGFAMRMLAGYSPIHQLYNPRSRLQCFPNVDYRFLVRTAINVARIVGKVHQTGCVIGDLNHSGIFVNTDATVGMIDADSFQIKYGGKLHRCKVGVPEFTPPELQGENLQQIERTKEHDLFGLAIAIFHLLFMGRHPYAGQYPGIDISMPEAIKQNKFAYSVSRTHETKTVPPPNTLLLTNFPPTVVDAFERAFGPKPSLRPSVDDWIKVLQELEISLCRCVENSGHFYPAAAKDCIWCHIKSKTSVDMFKGAERTRTTSSLHLDAGASGRRSLSSAPAEREVNPSITSQNSKAINTSSSPIRSRGGAFLAAWLLLFAFIGLLIWGNPTPSTDINQTNTSITPTGPTPRVTQASPSDRPVAGQVSVSDGLEVLSGRWITGVNGPRSTFRVEARTDSREIEQVELRAVLRDCRGEVHVVTLAQRALSGLGYNPGVADGVLGPRTQAAIRSFQRARGIQESGELDLQTRNSLGLPEVTDVLPTDDLIIVPGQVQEAVSRGRLLVVDFSLSSSALPLGQPFCYGVFAR